MMENCYGQKDKRKIKEKRGSMKTKIYGFKATDSIDLISNRESLEKYTGIFSQYFDRVGNCLSRTDISNMSNVALIYSRVTKLPTCGACNGGSVEIPDIWNIEIADAIFEHFHNQQPNPKFFRV